MERLKAAISKLQSGEGEEDSEEKVQLLSYHIVMSRYEIIIS